MPLPTKMPSAPSCIISAASAGVETPPAQNSTTGSLPFCGDLGDEFVRCAEIASARDQFFFRRDVQFADRVADSAHVAHRLDDVAAARFALAANHRRAFGDAPQRFAEVARAAHERRRERVLVDVILVVGRRKHFGFVDVIHAELLQHLGLGKVADANFRHDRNGHGVHDAADQLDAAHARDAAGSANIGRNALQRHHGDGAGFLSDAACSGVTTSMITPPLSICASPRLTVTVPFSIHSF